MQCPSLAIKAKFHPLPGFFLFFVFTKSILLLFLPSMFTIITAVFFCTINLYVCIIVALNNVIATFLFQRQKQTITKQHEWAVAWIVDILDRTFSICWWFSGNIPKKIKTFLKNSLCRSLLHKWIQSQILYVTAAARVIFGCYVNICIFVREPFWNTCIQEKRLGWFSDRCSGVEVRGCFPPARALCGPTDLSPLFV